MKTILFLPLYFLVGCSSPHMEPVSTDEMFQFNFRVADDEQTPVSGSAIRIGRQIRYVSSDGSTVERLKGLEGDALEVEVLCPAGWRSAPQGNKKQLILKKVTSNTTSSNGVREVMFTCIPDRKDHVLIVKSNHPLLPVQINGKTVGHTDMDGFTQLVIAGKPGETVHLQLDTDEYPLLLPKNPALMVTLPKKRKFLVFEQSFEKMKPVRRKRKVHSPGPRRL